MATYDYFEDQNLVVGVLAGEIDDERLLVIADDVSADERLEPGYLELVDVRRVTSTTHLTPDGLRKVAARARTALRPRGDRLALVVGEPLIYGLARIYAAYADETRSEIRVFRSLDEACAWLGVDCARVEIRQLIDG